MYNILSVAEKPSVAKELAKILCDGGNPGKKNGFSPFNHLWNIPHTRFLGHSNATMTMTSVSGHCMDIDFAPEYRSWKGTNPADLFDAPLIRKVSDAAQNIEKTLKAEAKRHNVLLLWLDCDLEGENIAFEVIQICTESNPRLEVYRARFSALIPRDVFRAMQYPERPNSNMNDAVEARKEIDLRIGAAFTRFQTLRIQNHYTGIDKMISYGPCQFPTLGFVIERHLRVEAFRSEAFWSLQLIYGGVDPDDPSGRMQCTFSWDRRRLFDQLAVLVLYETCMENPRATVVRSDPRPVTRWRPAPLNTVELVKRAARFLRMQSQRTMDIAEDLYNRGILSYPRTETDFFKEGFELRPLIEEQQGHSQWGAYAMQLIQQNNKFMWPKNGGHDDQAHPPIHPLKRVEAGDLKNEEERGVYELVVRHFLACCSYDAQGHQTTVTVQIGEPPNAESFSATGLMIIDRNWLEVYRWERWMASKVPTLRVGECFEPESLLMTEGHTESPQAITESDLIGIMDKTGIGTDATIPSHIGTIQQRDYAYRDPGGFFHPTKLGLALFEGYHSMGYQLTKPNLRASMERDCQLVARGQLSKQEMMQKALRIMRDVFIAVTRDAHKLDAAVAKYFDRKIAEDASKLPTIVPRFSGCGDCQGRMDLKAGAADGKERRALHCATCAKSHFLPTFGDVRPASSDPRSAPITCPICRFQVLTVSNPERKTEYHVCPKCYNDPPPPPAGPAVGSAVEFKCYQCAHACPLATRQVNADVDICACPDPNCSGTWRLKRVATGTMASCTNERRGAANVGGTDGCTQKTWWLPKCVSRAAPDPGRTCSNCLHSAGVSVKLLHVQFNLQTAPMGTEPEITACPCCHPMWAQQFDGRALALPSARPTQVPQQVRRTVSESRWPTPQLSEHATSVTFNGSVQTEVPSGGGQPFHHHGSAPTSTGWTAGPPAAPTVGAPLCRCNPPQLCKTVVVRKEGPTCGRPFFACAKPQAEQCKMFQWADESAGSSGGREWAATNRGPPAPAYKPQVPFQRDQQARSTGGQSMHSGVADVTCMHCGQQGHYARGCPNK